MKKESARVFLGICLYAASSMLAACSDPTSATAPADGGAATDGASTNDGRARDAATDDEDASAACDPGGVTLDGALVAPTATAGARPDPTGGEIADGTYVLSAIRTYDGVTDAVPPARMKWRFELGRANIHEEQPEGQFEEGVFDVSHATTSTLSLALECGTYPNGFFARYTAAGAELVIYPNGLQPFTYVLTRE